MRIPVRNLWLLQLFASHLYETAGDEFVAAEQLPEDLPRLVAKMLADEVSVRLHAGLSVGFTRTSSDLRRVRGRIDVLGTARHRLLERGKVRCRYDEVITDTPGNRLVRSALHRAAILIPDDPIYRSMAMQFEAAGVMGPAPGTGSARTLRRQRLLARDHRMISLAELLLDMSIPDQSDDEFATVKPEDGDEYLRKLFEHAAYGFYRHYLGRNGWAVDHGTRLSWDIAAASDGVQAVLPSMQIDISLREPTKNIRGIRRRVIIDTKFTSIVKSGHYRELTLENRHLYQIYAYLMSQNHVSDEHRHAEGLLLHPVVDGNFDEEVEIQGHRIRFATVDLRASATSIADQLTRAVSRRGNPPTG